MHHKDRVPSALCSQQTDIVLIPHLLIFTFIHSGRLEGCHGDGPPAPVCYLDESGGRVSALLKVLLSVLLLDLQSQTRAQDPLVPHNTTQHNITQHHTLVCIIPSSHLRTAHQLLPGVVIVIVPQLLPF